MLGAAEGVGFVEVVAIGEVCQAHVVQSGDETERLAALDNVRGRISGWHLGPRCTGGAREEQDPHRDCQAPRGVEFSHGRRP